MFQLFLFLHVMGAIAVFGPTFIFPIIASQAQKAPQHGAFAAALAEFIERRLVIPGAIVQGITGVALILILQLDLTAPTSRWLIAGIVLYAIAISFAIFVQAPAAEKMVHLTAAMSGPPPAGAAGGPPPEIVATGQKLQRGGMILMVLIVLIVILMTTKPSF
jgi:hypothetical protein